MCLQWCDVVLVHVHATEIAMDVFADFKQLLSEVGMRKVMLLIRDAHCNQFQAMLNMSKV